ncbi:MAG TPA: hypothetical protein VMU76_00360 [Acidimicrobiales bacterium]|nr:hypothetical protein [Acidimicrobiales bacterium]
MSLPPFSAPASEVAFGIVFGVFVVAIAVLAVVTVTWAVRRDRPGREAWRRRMSESGEGADPTGADGRRPGGRPGREVDRSS